MWPVAAALIAAGSLLGLERHRRSVVASMAILVALGWALGQTQIARPFWVPLVVGLVVAGLARDQDDLLHGECALKLLWVMGTALALSWAGIELLTLATGTDVVLEQWAVLELGLEPRFLWSTALPLSLLLGLVMLGGAPFHFWVADVFQGARPWLAPLAVALLQVTGAGWLSHRLAYVERFPAGAQLAWGLMHIAALTALIAGAATLLVQRRPERRVGTLASLNGALVLVLLASGQPLEPGWFTAWAAHLVLALTGASTVTRFLPVSAHEASRGAPLARRHRLATVAGLLCLASLAGFPGTPGGMLWLRVGRLLAQAAATPLLLALAATWLAALSVTLRQVRELAGVPPPLATEVRPVPVQARVALGISAVGLVALVAVRIVYR
jgi:NADH:ubiquinone oxidoreductase subunit 2 (subunit N)